MTEAIQVAGIVLCGGQSSRMGAPKEWLEFDGEPLLARVVRIVGEVSQPVIVAARPDQALPPLPDNVEVVRDTLGDAGPLAGIEAALTRLEGRAGAAFITACDHPLLQPAFIRRLIELMGNASGAVLIQEELVRPLPGIYSVRTLGLLRELLARGERRVTVFAERCGAVCIEAETLRVADARLDSLRNVNDQKDFRRTRNYVSAARNDGRVT